MNGFCFGLLLVSGLNKVLPEPEPQVHEAMRFPSEAHIMELRKLNAEHRKWVALQHHLRPLDSYTWFRWEAELTYADEALRLAEHAAWHRETGSVASCRTCLDMLREHIGAEAYYAGALPPPIPWHQARTRWPGR